MGSLHESSASHGASDPSPSSLPQAALPLTLVDLLSNSLLLHQTAPYLTVSALLALARTCRTLHSLILQSPDSFRYLDLSTVRSAVIDASPIDTGGISWRAERMDEALTEDEFNSGPLRGVFSKLARRNVLRNVSTMVLDGLSVPADIVREIIAEDRFNVRILSIREVKNLRERKLMQILRYAVRPSRPEGTPKLKGLYYFGPRDPASVGLPSGRNALPPRTPRDRGVMSSEGAQIGAEWNERSNQALSAVLARTEDRWYQATGRMLRRQPILEWAETLEACEGVIHFDAVLCRGPRHDPRTALSHQASDDLTATVSQYLKPAVAMIALGPSGCAKCGMCAEGPATFGQSPSSHLPLLSPPPLHSSTIRAAQRPTVIDSAPLPPLIARCEDCLRGRWCERCNKWWDEPCYSTGTRTELQQQELMQDLVSGLVTKPQEDIKVHMGLCVERCLVGEMMAGAGSAGMWG